MKRTLSLILSLLMLLSLFSGLTVVAAENDLADTGGDDTIYTSRDGQYYYKKLDDGTVEFNLLSKKYYYSHYTWFEIPAMIDGYQVTAVSDYHLGINASCFYIPACINDPGSKNSYKNNDHKDPAAIVYERVRPSWHNNDDGSNNVYPLYEYHLKDDGTAVLDIIRPNGFQQQVIPDTLWDGTEVTGIGPQAFPMSRCGEFRNVVISHVFDSIDQGFFSDFYGLSLTLHVTGETQIAEGAFDNCYAPDGIILNVVGDKDIPTGFCPSDPGHRYSVNVGGEIKQIKEGTFNRFPLVDITIDGNVETVGTNAFSYTNAESLTLKNGVKTIGERAFYRCGFSEVTIPKSVTQIGNQAFGYIFDADYETAVKIDGFTIYGYRNTAAERYANENGFTFVPLDDIAFDLWLGTTQVTADNIDDICGDGKATFDPYDNTLTLNDPTITGVHSYNAGDTAKIYTTMPKLTLTGSYHMTAPEAEFGIRSDNNTLRFDGDFTFMGAGTGVVGSEYITVKSGLLTASGQYGLSLNPEGSFSIYSDTAKVDLSGSESAVQSGAKYLSVSASLRIITPEDAKILADSSGLKNFYEADGTTLAKHVLLEKPAPLITSASCTVTEPVAGQKPSYTATVPAGKGYQVEEDFTDGTWVNGVLWHNDTDNKDMTESEIFENGKQYTATVLLELSDDNYSFISSVSGTMNSNYAKVINYGDGTIAVYRTFTCTATVISDFSVTNIIEPVAGASPSYIAAVPAGNGYQISNTNNIFTKNGIGWFNMTDSTFLFPANNDKFAAGKEYGVFITLETTSNDYQFSDEPSATVNGKPATISAKGKNSITVFYIFNGSYILGDADDNGEIESVDATFVQRYAASIPTPYITQVLMQGDVDGDGNITVMDATAIQYYLANMKNPHNIGKTVS